MSLYSILLQCRFGALLHRFHASDPIVLIKADPSSVELLSCPEQWGEYMEAENNSRANGIQPITDTDILDVIYVYIYTYIYNYVHIIYIYTYMIYYVHDQFV